MVTYLQDAYSSSMSFLEIFSTDLKLAKTNLGKYIILAACMLHIGWAIMLLLDVRAGGATPLSAIIYIQGGNRWITIFSLLLASGLSIWYLSLKAGHKISTRAFSAMLFPQLWFLLYSSGSVIHDAWVGYYIDSVTYPGLFVIVYRPSSFILSSHFPVIVIATLYVTAIFQAGLYKVK